MAEFEYVCDVIKTQRVLMSYRRDRQDNSGLRHSSVKSSGGVVMYSFINLTACSIIYHNCVDSKGGDRREG